MRDAVTPVMKVGDFIEACPTNHLIYNLMPLFSRAVITGRLLKTVSGLHGESDTNFYLELPNGEVLKGVNSYPPVGRDRVHWLKDLVGTEVRFRCTPPVSARYERLQEPRLGIESTMTRKKDDLSYQWIPPEELADELYGFTEFTVPNENSETLFTGVPFKPESGNRHTMTFYGLLKEIPLYDDLLLDTGIGAFYAEGLPEDFIPGEYVKCTIPQLLYIEPSNDEYPTDLCP
jgi:hypothetical protein